MAGDLPVIIILFRVGVHHSYLELVGLYRIAKYPGIHMLAIVMYRMSTKSATKLKRDLYISDKAFVAVVNSHILLHHVWSPSKVIFDPNPSLISHMF